MMTADLRERGSVESLAAGKTYCHAHERAALGYFRRKAREINAAAALRDIAEMKLLDPFKMYLKRAAQAFGEEASRDSAGPYHRERRCGVPKSMSFTRSRTHSIKRRPLP